MAMEVSGVPKWLDENVENSADQVSMVALKAMAFDHCIFPLCDEVLRRENISLLRDPDFIVRTHRYDPEL